MIVVVVADPAPLIYLAAAGVLDRINPAELRFVLIDRVEDDLYGDPGKPYARDIADWINRMGAAIQRTRTVEGAGIAALRACPDGEGYLNKTLQHSTRRAVREYVEMLEPGCTDTIVVLFEDGAILSAVRGAGVRLNMMTTRFFAAIHGAGTALDAMVAATGSKLQPMEFFGLRTFDYAMEITPIAEMLRRSGLLMYLSPEDHATWRRERAFREGVSVAGMPLEGQHRDAVAMLALSKELPRLVA